MGLRGEGKREDKAGQRRDFPKGLRRDSQPWLLESPVEPELCQRLGFYFQTVSQSEGRSGTELFKNLST